jgi:hypothetical protein
MVTVHPPKFMIGHAPRNSGKYALWVVPRLLALILCVGVAYLGIETTAAWMQSVDVPKPLRSFSRAFLSWVLLALPFILAEVLYPISRTANAYGKAIVLSFAYLVSGIIWAKCAALFIGMLGIKPLFVFDVTGYGFHGLTGVLLLALFVVM